MVPKVSSGKAISAGAGRDLEMLKITGVDCFQPAARATYWLSDLFINVNKVAPIAPR